MRPLILFLFPFFFLACSSNQIYVVRHAEKAISDHADPPLSPEGEARSVALAEWLKDKQIAGVFSTAYLRTRQTADPTAGAFGLSTQLYSHDTLARFVEQRINPGKNYLVVGHSNTVLNIVKALGAQPTITEIRDEEYDYLFIVSKKRTLFRKKTTLAETAFIVL